MNRAVSGMRGMRFGLPLLLVVSFLTALAWSRARDPYRRIDFSIRTPDGNRTRGIAVLPKSARSCPVAVYLHRRDEDLVKAGSALRQFAELGLAAVGLEYDRTKPAAFDGQFAALREFLSRQSWAATNGVAWIGHDNDALRLFAFALAHPEAQPRVLVCLGCRSREQEGSPAPDPEKHRAIGSRVLLVGVDEARGLAASLKQGGTAVDRCVLPNLPDDFGPNRDLVQRGVAEYCAAALGATQRLGANSRPSCWYYWLPAGLVAFVFVGAEYRRRRKSFQAEHVGRSKARYVFAGLTWLLATAALAQTALHFVLPRLSASESGLALAQRWLVRPSLHSDFEWLARQPIWQGQRTKTFLDHVELADLQRRLFYADLDAAVYRECILSPVVDGAAASELNWRRPLWENFYPRIRKETDAGMAAEIVVRFLRERVSINSGRAEPAGIESAWERGMTDAAGFESLYVAALRSVGVAARRDASGNAELWTGSKWVPAPRPLISVLVPAGFRSS